MKDPKVKLGKYLWEKITYSRVGEGKGAVVGPESLKGEHTCKHVIICQLSGRRISTDEGISDLI